jgi:Flp pilus assembly protein TadD
MLGTLAALERRAGDLRASEMSARRAIELDPDDWWSRVELAKTLELAGRREEARGALRDALQSREVARAYRARIQAEIERLSNPNPLA